MLERHAAPTGAMVHTPQDSLGASTSFATTLSTENATDAIRRLRHEGHAIRRVLLPSSMYWIQNGYSVDGRSHDDLRRELLDLDVTLARSAYLRS